jgi:HAD superfamily hydrolase (TIGR01549 family)
MNKRYTVPIVTFFSIYGLLWGLAEPLGLTPGLPLLLKVIASTIVVTVVFLLSDELIRLRRIVIPELKSEICSANRVELVTIDHLFKKLSDLKDGAVIKIFASGSETYYVQFKALLNNIKINNISINVMIRSAPSQERRRKVQEMVNKWLNLSKEHSLKINTYIYEFDFMFRGIIIDNKIGFLGLYHRIDNETTGQEYPFGGFSNDSEIGSIFIHQSSRLFDSISSKSIRNFKIKCYILDLHGTIVVDDRWAEISRKSAIEAISATKNISTDDSNRILLDVISKLESELGYKPSLTRAVEETGTSWNIWNEYQKKQLWPIDGLSRDNELIDSLDKLRLYSSVIILTNNSRFISNLMLVGCGIINYVDQLITRENMDEPKPNKEILLNIVKSQNIAPEECMVIGDRHVIDLELAEELGMKACLVSDTKPLVKILNDLIA